MGPVFDTCPECGHRAIIARYSTHLYCNRCHPEDNEHSEYIEFDFGCLGHVYFIQSSTGPIKIGWSRAPTTRLRAIQNNSPVPLVLLATKTGFQHLERQLHWRFRKYRLRGEWFEPVPKLLKYIQSLKSEGEVIGRSRQ